MTNCAHTRAVLVVYWELLRNKLSYLLISNKVERTIKKVAKALPSKLCCHFK